MYNYFEESLLRYWKVRPKVFNKAGRGLFFGLVMEPCVLSEALVCLDTEWLREKCMAGTHVFFECCGSCLPSFDLSETLLPFDFAARPMHVVAPVLPARLLLVDFDALPEATALSTQNPSPVVTTFRRCEFVAELKVWIGSPVINLAGHHHCNGPRLFWAA